MLQTVLSYQCLSALGCHGNVGWFAPSSKNRATLLGGFECNLSCKLSIHNPSHFLTILQGMDQLANWPKVLDQFRKTISKSLKPIQFASDRGSPFRLLRLIARNNTNKNYNAIESNFLYAAMHIACMKELRFLSEVCPDLPDNLDALART